MIDCEPSNGGAAIHVSMQNVVGNLYAQCWHMAQNPQCTGTDVPSSRAGTTERLERTRVQTMGDRHAFRYASHIGGYVIANQKL